MAPEQSSMSKHFEPSQLSASLALATVKMFCVNFLFITLGLFWEGPWLGQLIDIQKYFTSINNKQDENHYLI